MKELDIQDLPPTAKTEVFMVREQILQELERSQRQREQQEQVARKLKIKAKRRIRKQQRGKRV